PVSDHLTLYLVLCYRACPADDVPIPGEPCRSEDDLMEPSRLRDDFSIELSFDPLPQAEEKAVRAFVHWLRQIDIVDDSAASPLEDDLGAFLDALRAAAPDFEDASPLLGVTIPQDDACSFFRAAFRVWVTEIRPLLREGESGCGCGCGALPPGRDCLL